MEDYPLSLRGESLSFFPFLSRLIRKLTNPHYSVPIAAATVIEGRKGAEEILRGEDDRLLVVSTPYLKLSLFLAFFADFHSYCPGSDCRALLCSRE